MGNKQPSGMIVMLQNEICNNGSEKVSVQSATISDDELSQLSALLQNSVSVTELRLRNCSLNHRGIYHVATVLPSTQITKLLLSCNEGIRDSGALPLMAALPNSRVQELSLDTTGITDRTARALASVMPRCYSLRTVFLGGNEISDVGACLIAEALPRSSLHRLFLSGSKIRDLGAKSFGEAITKHPMQVLTLSANYITDIGARYLAEGVSRCPSMEKIDLSCNDVSNESVCRFTQAISRHPSIKTVSFLYTATTASMIQHLDNYIAKLHTEKAKLLTILCACSMLMKGEAGCPASSFPIDLIRCLNRMLFRQSM